MNKQNLHSTIYHIARTTQRLSLYVLGLVTILYWVVQAAIAIDLSLALAQKEAAFKEPEVVNEAVRNLLNLQGDVVIKWAIITTLLTLGLLVFGRVRMGEKQLVADSMVFIGFCVAAAAMVDPIIRSITTHVL